MRFLFTKRAVATITVLVLIGIGSWVFVVARHNSEPPNIPVQPIKEVSSPVHAIIGTSVEGRAIDSYTYLPAGSSAQTSGNSGVRLAFVGGMHGGYEWNSVLLAYQFIDYLDANPSAIPKNLTIAVIPDVNPDGVYKVTGKVGRFVASDVSGTSESQAPGRFNAHKVDLNRNFDCKWQPESMWKKNKVSAGTAPFSEPETKTFRDFVSAYKPTAVIFWHSQSNAVYASECKAGILPETLDVMNTYSHASGYPAVRSFDAYEITGDAEGWLASIGIPAITVELQTHEPLEWERNLAGIKGLFEYYGNKKEIAR